MVSVAARKKRKTAPVEVPDSGSNLLEFTKEHSGYIALAVLALVAFGCYADALANGFVFDDHGHILTNPSFRSLTNVPKLLFASYRPLRDISYALDFAIWGEYLASRSEHLVGLCADFADHSKDFARGFGCGDLCNPPDTAGRGDLHIR